MAVRFEPIMPGVEYDTATQTAFVSPRRFQSDGKLKSTDPQWTSVILTVVRMWHKSYANLPVRQWVIMGDHS